MNNQYLKLFGLFFSLFVLLVAGCSTQDNQPSLTQKEHKISFVDLAGNKINLEKPAERIFLSFYQESYYAIVGDFDQVVCMSKTDWKDFFNGQYDVYQENVPKIKEITDVGSIYKGSIDLEGLLNTRPDVALFSKFHYDALEKSVLSKLESAGITIVVVDFNAQTLEKHLESIRIIGKVTGREENANKIAKEYEEAIHEVQQRVSTIPEQNRKRVYIELGNLGSKEQGNTYGDYLWGSLVKIAGGKNIAEFSVENFGPVSPEFILQSNPELILFSGSLWPKEKDAGNRILMGFGVDPSETNKRILSYLERPGWKHLDAVIHNQVYSVDHAGLRSAYDYVYVQYIAKSLYPDLFQDIDPQKNLENFYNEYLPIRPIGNFMYKYRKESFND